jgi:transposase
VWLTLHRALEGLALLPNTHCVDAGSLDAEILVSSYSTYAVDRLGPVSLDGSWQAQSATAFDVTHFHIDWAAHQVSCPASRTSRWWMSSTDRHSKEAIRVKFAPTDCQGCLLRLNCTRGQSRTLTLHSNPAEYQALHAARQRQSTPEFRAQYARRAGVEGTISQAVRVSALRRTRYMGLQQARLQAIITATALNSLRIGAWLAEIPHAHTPTSRFVALISSAPEQRAIA